ncbi:MAG: type II secretion system protein, partial [Planctomycetota bacterium]
LIELLVVIAIIGILASMVFPVFARARESARKAVCLSNIKNLALAVQMYLADNNDTFPPAEHRQEAYDFFATGPGGGDPAEDCHDIWHIVNFANPYLRWPVVLDEYVKNRDVWQCPSAKMEKAASFIVPGPDWLGYLMAHEGEWGDGTDPGGPCLHMTFPPGWGGEVTDSLLQQRNAGIDDRDGSQEGAHKTFIQTITPGQENFYDAKLVTFSDVAHVPVIADGGLSASWLSIGTMAYPDICCAECGGIAPYLWGWGGVAAGLADCPNGQWCQDCVDMHATNVWYDGNGYSDHLRKAATRHLGGSNIGWADGHASWVSAQRLSAMADDGDIEGVGWICSPETSYQGHVANCGTPPAGVTFLYNVPRSWTGE